MPKAAGDYAAEFPIGPRRTGYVEFAYQHVERGAVAFCAAIEMNDKFANQELLPPISQEPNSLSGWVSWLFDPLPQRFMLPATGLLMLGLDWFLFSGEAATVGLAAPATAVFGFLAGSIGTYQLQRRFGLDSRPVAIGKALLAGLFVGVPFPMAGSLVGAWVLASSGLATVKQRFLSRHLARK
jgi:hypothetical protein